MGDAHREALESVMDMLRMAVDLEGPCDFGERPGTAPMRAAFLAHFSDLADPLAAWDEAVVRTRETPTALWSWLSAEAERRGIVEPTYAVGALIDKLAIGTAERSRRGDLVVPYRLLVEHYLDRFADGERVSVYIEGQRVAQLPREPVSTISARVQAVEHLIQQLFDDAQASSAAAAIGDAREAMLDLKQPLLDDLALHAAVDTIVFAGDCPLCAAASANEEPDASETGPPG